MPPAADRLRSRIPEIGAELQAISVPATTFTGDFFFWSRTGGPLLFALGDVAGKGLRAAVYMAMIQEELERSVACENLPAIEPAAVVARLHALLRREMENNKFVSLVLGSLDGHGTLTVVNAGHWPPLIARGGGDVEAIPSTGPVLGSLPSTGWFAAVRRLEPGDMVVLYTDGVVEAESPDEEEFGIDRMREILRSTRSESVADRVMHELARHRDGKPQHDDVTILALRFESPVSTPWSPAESAVTRSAARC